MPYENFEVFVQSDVINHPSFEGIMTCQLTYIMIMKQNLHMKKMVYDHDIGHNINVNDFCSFFPLHIVFRIIRRKKLV